jgi:hypothetical protein
VQLKQSACTQDRVVLSLFKNKTVNYVGTDFEFSKKLSVDSNSRNLIATVNSPMWVSDFINHVRTLLEPNKFETFYISVNRYLILGNDTDIIFDQSRDIGAHIINLLETISMQQGYKVSKSDYFDDDRGRHMNFVQPVTWVYGTSTSNI